MIFCFKIDNGLVELRSRNYKSLCPFSHPIIMKTKKIPKKTLELSKPLSELDSPRSQVAGGRINDIASTSIASLDNAHPQRANNL